MANISRWWMSNKKRPAAEAQVNLRFRRRALMGTRRDAKPQQILG
jgi:hypothetical protein